MNIYFKVYIIYLIRRFKLFKPVSEVLEAASVFASFQGKRQD
jgi:hypothetical protein